MTDRAARPIIRALPSLFLWQTMTVGAGFLAQMILARTLGPHDKGVLDLFLLVPFVVSGVTDLGLLSANTYFAGKGTIEIRSLHGNSLLWSAGIGILALGAGVIIVVFSGSPFPSLTSGFFLLAISGVGPSLYFSLWSGLMYGSDEARSVYRISGLFSIVSLFAYALAILLGLSLIWFLFLGILLLLVRALISLFSMRARIPFSFRLDHPALKQSVMYGLGPYVGLAFNTLHFRLNQFVVESMLGPAALGNYALAVRVGELLWLFDYVVVTASLYRITAGPKEEAILAAQRAFRFVTLLVGSLAGLMALSAPLLIPFFFGELFQSATAALWVLLPGIVFWSMGRALSPLISFQYGKPWYNTFSAAGALVLNICFTLVLVPRFGIEGAALATSISYLVNFSIIAWMFFRFTDAGIAETFLPKKADFHIVLAAMKEKYLQFMS